MGTAVGWFMAIARLVASWPGAELIVPQAPAAALAAFRVAVDPAGAVEDAARPRRRASGRDRARSDGRNRARRSLSSAMDGHAALVRDGGRLHLIASSQDAFAIREWLLAMGEGRHPTRSAPRARHLRRGRLLRAAGWRQPPPPRRTANAVEEDCGRAAILVSPLVVPERCRATGTLVFDRKTLTEAGSIALLPMTDEEASRSGQRWRVVTARQPGFTRPWTGPAARRGTVQKAAADPALGPDPLPLLRKGPPGLPGADARKRSTDERSSDTPAIPTPEDPP